MFRDATRFGNDPTEIRRTKKLRFPLQIKEPSKIFVCSWSDFFHEDVPKEWRRDAWEIMYHAKEHTFLILTKRPENIKDMLPVGWIEGQHRKWSNIWLGVTAENQATADERIPQLLEIPAAIKFISCEPLLGKILINKGGYGNTGFWIDELDWVIVGGESGSGGREMKLSWARNIRDQCRDCGVPFFMKQMTGNTKALREAIPEDLMTREFPS
jgi:protein gp37